MLLVVFGAGASYDSAPSYPVSADPIDLRARESRPPLADQLFENRDWFAEALRKFPRCQPLIQHLRHLDRGKNVEQVLAAYLKEGHRRPERHCQIMAVRYYIAYIIKACEEAWEGVHKGVTNYKALLDHIETWRCQNRESVCLVTFNYDQMLELALADVGLRFEELGDYIASQDYKLLKLHGSVNWGRYTAVRQERLPGTDPWVVANELTNRAASLELTEVRTLVNQQPPTMPPLPDRLTVMPAIAIPIENKNAFECPVEHVEVLKECLPRVTKMVTIGWRATENHFLRLLSEGLPKISSLMVVSVRQQEALEIGRKISPGRSDFDAAPGGFTDSILSREIERFLWR